MAMRTVYGTQASGAQVPGSTLDAIFLDIFQLGAATQCTATGTNTIALAPFANQAVVTTPAPANGQMFSWVAAATSTGAVTVAVNAGTAFPLFLPGGSVQANANNVLQGAPYLTMFLTALNSGAGGLVVIGSSPPSEPINAQTGTSYTVVQGDLGKLITLTNAAAIAVTLPQATGLFSANWYADFTCLSSSVGSVTITPTTSTINAAATLVLTPGQAARVISDGTNYQIIKIGSAVLTSLTNTLSGDVALNNAGLYFDGPTVAQGTLGTWFVSGTVTVTDTVSAATTFNAKLWDGTTVIASTEIRLVTANAGMPLSLSGLLAAPAGNLRISVQSGNTTSLIKFNISGNSKDSTITAVRIA